jgi:hypothetical protein
VHHGQVHHHCQFRRMPVIAGAPPLRQLGRVGRQQGQQLGVIQRIGRALELPRHLPRLPYMHADAEAGQRHQDHGQPVLEPLRQHFRPPQQGRQHCQARQAPAQPMDATALRPVHHHRTGHQCRGRSGRQLGQPVAATAAPPAAQPGGSARRW